jgi:cysteinyl-tRNA synthetase
MTMNLKFYNTLTRRKEAFIPIDPTCIRFYVCGPTVYNYIHIGNARPAVIFDVLFRVLQQHYPQVKYVRNITDVDDKIHQAAQAANTHISTITQQFTEAYHQDLHTLGNLAPTLEPRATEHIPAMINMIETLISKGHAYVAEQHVLFAVNSDADYGKLSHRQLDDMLAGARVDPLPFKQHPGDFVLWKPSVDGWPGWDSPWGFGRPGWHIECSAMIRQHLGDQIDLHGGGQDLIFPHHENEIAQSECACGQKPFVNYWLHNGYITLDQEKMSKSLGNMITVRELLSRYSAEVLRYVLLSTHYRSPLNWSDELVEQAQQRLDRLYQRLRDAVSSAQTNSNLRDQRPLSASAQALSDALADDLNTPLALMHLQDLAQQLSQGLVDAADLRQSGQMLGLLQQDPEAYFKQRPSAAGHDTLDETAIEQAIVARNQARRDKDFAKADQIRQQLLAQKIELEDSAQGTRWRRQ